MTSAPHYTSSVTIPKPSFSRPLTPATLFGLRISALVEILAALSLMLLWDTLQGTGDHFMSITPHPFWIVVLLVTLQYGIAEALAAAVLSSIFLLAGNLPLQSLNETMYTYAARIGLLPFIWISAALVLGGIRSRQLHERQRLWQRLESAEEEKIRLADNYQAIKQSKEKLELRLVEECHSVAMVYDAAKTLEATHHSDRPAEKMEAASRLVQVALNPKQFSIFRLEEPNEGGALVLETSHNWEKSSSYATRFEADTPLAQAVVGNRQALSIINAEDEQALEGEGIMAGPIFDPKTGKVFGMLKIEDIAFTEMGIRTHKTFHVVCEWLARTYAAEEASMLPDSKKILSITNARAKKKLSVEDKAHAAL